MANTKKQSKTKSRTSKKDISTPRAKTASKSAATSRSSSRVQSAGSASEENFAQASYQKAKSFIDQNTNLPTAGLALAGAGILALISTQKGRSFIKAGAEAVISLVNLQAVTTAVTDALPESISSTFKSEKPLQSKTDFASTKRASGKQAAKSAKAQF